MINKDKRVKEFLFLGIFAGSTAVFAILIAWFSNTEIGKSPLTISIVTVVWLLPMVVYDYISLIPFLKRYINKKSRINKQNFHN